MIYSLTDVTKSYQTRHGTVSSLNGVSFDVSRGEMVALIGPSGAGKTTLFRLLNATLRPTSGAVQFDGQDVGAMSGRELRAMRRRIGTVYQQHHLVPSLSALENALCGRLGYWSLLQTLRSMIGPPKEEAERAMAALEAVGLADKSRARADELSGGQQQRLAIARVLLQDPEVILADEPFASLDPALTESIASLLVELVDHGKRTMVVTLHDVELALRYFPRIIGLRAGRIAFDAPTTEVSRRSITELYAGNSGLAEPVELAEQELNKASRESVRKRSCAR